MPEISVTIVEGRNLEKKDFFSENDPFVELFCRRRKERQISNTSEMELSIVQMERNLSLVRTISHLVSSLCDVVFI